MKMRKIQEKRDRRLWELSYWLLPVIAIIFQAIFSFNALGQIRTEELIDSVRSVWWFQNRLVTDGGYSNLGWYTVLTLAYNIFGFNLYAAKFVKLAIILLALFCLASVLKKYLGQKRAWMPFLTIGLSPTLLYFNTLQIPQILDFYYFVICLYLVAGINFKSSLQPVRQILFGATAMFGWLTYPGFIYYLPILFVIYAIKLIRHFGADRPAIFKNALFSFIGFITPLVLEVLYIQNRGLLLFDRSFQRGLLRSNGGFDLNLNLFLDNLRLLITDLFLYYNSFYFEVAKVEFSDYYPVAAIVFVFAVSFYIGLAKNKYRYLVWSIGFFLLIYLALLNFVGPFGLGGIRRGSVLLVLFYGLFCVVWDFVLSQKRLNVTVKYFLIGILSLFLIHHLVVIPVNLKHLRLPTPYRDRFWFAQAETPEKSLSIFMEKIQKEDLLLGCVGQDNKPVNCGGYSLIDAAIKGSCYWNRLQCKKLTAYDIKLNEFVPLTFDFWANNNWER